MIADLKAGLDMIITKIGQQSKRLEALEKVTTTIQQQFQQVLNRLVANVFAFVSAGLTKQEEVFF